jgi:7-carboxy-7-deazaguanine synthase
MTYTVKEIFKSLQGEGAHVGTAAVFLRFSGCNLWSGREKDRAKAICKFCDTDFVGGTKYETADALADAVAAEWAGKPRRFVILTGGEPLLQYDAALWRALRERGFYIAVETNGTINPGRTHGINWVCVSPKAGAPLRSRTRERGQARLPAAGSTPKDCSSRIVAKHYWLQPMDGPDREANTQAAIAYCLDNPRWRLSIQTHKVTGIR